MQRAIAPHVAAHNGGIDKPADPFTEARLLLRQFVTTRNYALGERGRAMKPRSRKTALTHREASQRAVAAMRKIAPELRAELLNALARLDAFERAQEKEIQ